MKVVIIEDEPRAMARLNDLLDELDAGVDVLAKIESVAEAVEWFRTNEAPDLIFIDIHLSDGSSFEIFDRVQLSSPIVFATAYDQYALKAFEVNSVDYLLKPIDRQALERSVSKFRAVHSKSLSVDYSLISQMIEQKVSSYKTRFLVSKGPSLIPIEVGQIAYFYTLKGGVFLCTKANEQHMVNFNLEELEKMLDPHDFFRLNRQFIAHSESVVRVHNYFNSKLKIELFPVPDVEVLVSRLKAADFKRWMGE